MESPGIAWRRQLDDVPDSGWNRARANWYMGYADCGKKIGGRGLLITGAARPSVENSQFVGPVSERADDTKIVGDDENQSQTELA